MAWERECEESHRRELRRRRDVVASAGSAGIGVPSRFAGVTIHAVDDIGVTASCIERWWSGKPCFLTITGPVGVGKTHVAAGLAHHLWAKGAINCRSFWTAGELIGHLRRCVGQGNVEDVLDAIKRVPVLIIDDLGREAATDWVRSLVLELYDYRYREVLPTVTTTNLTLAELGETFDERLSSRLASGEVITLDGKDRRVT